MFTTSRSMYCGPLSGKTWTHGQHLKSNKASNNHQEQSWKLNERISSLYISKQHLLGGQSCHLNLSLPFYIEHLRTIYRQFDPSMFYSLFFLFSLSHSSHSRFCSQLRRVMATGLFEAAMPWVHRIVCQSSDGAKRGGKLSSLCRLLLFTQLGDCCIWKSISDQWILKLTVSSA